MKAAGETFTVSDIRAPGETVRRYQSELQGPTSGAVALVVAYDVWLNRAPLRHPDARLRPAAPGCRGSVRRAALYPAEPPWTRVPDLPAGVAFLDIADARRLRRPSEPHGGNDTDTHCEIPPV